MAVLDQEEEEPTSTTYMQGDSLDFGVCSMPIKKRKLVLFAEMKLPEKLG
jgi:hypothetical protein